MKIEKNPRHYRCAGVTAAGKRCKRHVTRKGGRCPSHKGQRKSAKKKPARKNARCKAILVSGKRCKCYCAGSSGVYCASHKGGKRKVTKRKTSKKRRVRRNTSLFGKDPYGSEGYFPLPAGMGRNF